MGSVLYVKDWSKSSPKIEIEDIRTKMMGLNDFIRSKIIPPQLGSVVFNFAGGKVSLTGDVTHITGGDCEIHVQRDNVVVTGCRIEAYEVFCSIHREIEDLRACAN